MNHVFTIKSNPDQHSQLVIHPEKATTLGIENQKFAYLMFGSRSHAVTIIINHELAQNILVISGNLVDELHLPDYPYYELVVNQNEITIGPYIGLLMSDEDKRLTSSRLHKMTVYVKEYAKLHGAIVVFSLDKVDPQNRLIEGYCYNPVRQFWHRGIFPYPSAIFRTIGLNREWKNHFRSVIGDKLFNSRFFGKWEMVQWFSKEPEIKPYIPYTVFYHSPQDIFQMLEMFPQIYIKPVHGLQGRGIVRVSLEKQMFIIKYREKNVNQMITFEGREKASEYIQRRFGHGRYLVQQAIDLLEDNGGLIDFRCVLQKNQSNSWVCQAIIGRVGVKNSVVSNISSGGAAFIAEKILRKVLSSSEETIADLKLKMTALAITICKKLDEYSMNFGTLGLDIGIDKQGHLWLIEINNRDPDPGIALDIHDVQLYYTLKTGPLFYAKYLAGFEELKD